MSFIQETYPASEADGSVEVCFNVTGEFERAVSIQLSTADISAEEGADYEGISRNITLQSQGTTCIDIVLLGDSRLEEEEALEVNLTSSDTTVNFTLSRTEIRIMDINR